MCPHPAPHHQGPVWALGEYGHGGVSNPRVQGWPGKATSLHPAPAQATPQGASTLYLQVITSGLFLGCYAHVPLTKLEYQDPKEAELAGEKGGWEGHGCTMGGLSARKTTERPRGQCWASG